MHFIFIPVHNWFRHLPHLDNLDDDAFMSLINPARALRALGLLLADGAPTVGGGEDFLSRQPDFFTETAVTLDRKVEKLFPRWEINRHVEG